MHRQQQANCSGGINGSHLLPSQQQQQQPSAQARPARMYMRQQQEVRAGRSQQIVRWRQQSNTSRYVKQPRERERGVGMCRDRVVVGCGGVGVWTGLLLDVGCLESLQAVAKQPQQSVHAPAARPIAHTPWEHLMQLCCFALALTPSLLSTQTPNRTLPSCRGSWTCLTTGQRQCWAATWALLAGGWSQRACWTWMWSRSQVCMGEGALGAVPYAVGWWVVLCLVDSWLVPNDCTSRC